MRRGALIALALLVVGCGTGAPQATGPVAPSPTAPVPMASLSPALAAASATIQRRLGGAGFRLEHVVQPFRTGEPAALQHVPRALFRVMLSDPDSGWVVLYDLRTSQRAAGAGRDLAAYLSSGFGQTNFPMDAQFTVNQIDSTLMFSWWSRERAGDPEQAQAAFEELRRVGQPFPVVR